MSPIQKGKKFCPDSKGISEETIELAFVESYKLLCNDNRDVLDEFLARTEETLSQDNASKQLAKIESNTGTKEPQMFNICGSFLPIYRKKGKAVPVFKQTLGAFRQPHGNH